MRFAPGRQVLHRNFRREVLSWVRPGYVVGHDASGLALWVPPGSPIRTQVASDGRTLRDMTFAEWVTLPHLLVAAVWTGPGLL